MRLATRLAALAVLAVVPAFPATGGTADDLLTEARDAAEHTAFSGHAVVRWREGSVSHQEELDVKGKDGVFLAEGRRQVMGVGHQRLVFSPSDGWHELWTERHGSLAQPALSSVYEVRPAGERVVADREPTDVYELWKLGVLREKLYIDKDTRLLLRREQFDRSGTEERAFFFQTIVISGPVDKPSTPENVEPDAPSKRGTGASAPTLDEGYKRLGAFRHDDITEFVYGDGLYDLSLFQQQGRVEEADLPSPRRSARVDGRQAWQFSWAGGEGLVWSAGPTVYTLMGDVPPDELMRVAGSVPVHRSTSIAHRIRQACRGLVESFTGGG